MYRGILDSNIKNVTSGLILNLDASQLRSYPGTGTTWTDLSGNSNNGTLTNGPTFSSANGGSIVFDGINDFAALGTPSALKFASGAFTVDMWFKTNNAVSPQVLISYGNDAYAFYIHNGQIWFAKPRAANDGGGPSISSNIWYHVALIDNIGTNILYYLNGVLTNTNTFTQTPTYLKSLRIGSSDDEGYYFNGNIASSKVYNRALSASEVLQNYNVTKARFGL